MQVAMEKERAMAAKTSRATGAAQVEAFLAALDHPLKPVIVALREVILSADPSIAEGIKWNAPSFYTTEHFAAFHLRAKDGVKIMMHLGAKPRDTAQTGIAIDDPAGLLEWLAKDRASVTFRDLGEVEARRDTFVGIIRQWIKYV